MARKRKSNLSHNTANACALKRINSSVMTEETDERLTRQSERHTCLRASEANRAKQPRDYKCKL